MDNTIFYHLLFDQLEGRTNGLDNEFRWDGEGWIRTDMANSGSSQKVSLNMAE